MPPIDVNSHEYIPQYLVDPATLHIALATFPQDRSQKDYIEDIEKYFSDSKDKSIGNLTDPAGDAFENYYKPLKYYILGGYDICFITLVGSYKFAQNLFDNQNTEVNNKGFQNSFQIITGSTPKIQGLASSSEILYSTETKLFGNPKVSTQSKCQDKAFVGVCNLKLSNPLLIGNGQIFLDDVYRLIIKRMKEKVSNVYLFEGMEIIILQSYSWFEISILVFTDKIEDIGSFIKKLRWQMVCHLSEGCLDNTNSILDNSMFQNESDGVFTSSHIFSDSHTYIGISYDKVNKIDGSSFTSDQEEQVLKSSIEWQIKPGHLNELKKELQETDKSPKIINGIFDTEKPVFITGKTDYIIPLHKGQNKVSTNVSILKWINSLNGIFDNFRKIKTKVIFTSHSTKSPYSGKEYDKIDETVGFQEQLKALTKCSKSLEIDSKLKSLNISRTMRAKISKIYYLYNLGIQDPVLFTFFLDFMPFMDVLYREIEQMNTNTSSNSLCLVSDFQNRLDKFITVFDEGFYWRMYNSYFADDLGDSTDLDFNSSIQQLLTTYTTITNKVASTYFGSIPMDSGYAQIVQINLKNTVSTTISINYSIANLSSPELFFSTVYKEILNAQPDDLEESGIEEESPLKQVKKQISNFKINGPLIDNIFLNENKKGEIEDYLAIDCIKYSISFNEEPDLYAYYFWLYFAQSSALYTKFGNVMIARFKDELFRLMYVIAVHDFSKLDKLECPDSLYGSHWENYFHSFLKEFKDNESQFVKLSENIKKVIEEISNPIFFELTKANRRQFYIKHFTNEGNLKPFSGFFERVEPSQMGATILNLMYGYMKHIYELNGKKLRILKRDKDKKVIQTIIKNDNYKGLYYADTLGGVFYHNRANAIRYFQSRDAMLQTLWHLGQLIKKETFA